MSAHLGWGRVVGLGIAAAALIQVVPYGRHHVAPPSGLQVVWDSPRTEDLARRACFDCHSNETRWPWYASIAPMSWRIQHHVDEGRERFNVSALDARSDDGRDAIREAGESVTKREMPPRDYLLLHPNARLSPAERRALADGLDRSLVAVTKPGPAGNGLDPEEEKGEEEARGR